MRSRGLKRRRAMSDPKRAQSDDEDEAQVAMGARLRQAREFLGLSQESVAEALGVPRASISTMESGRRKVSSLELRELARLYRRPLEWFYGGGAGPAPPDPPGRPPVPAPQRLAPR